MTFYRGKCGKIDNVFKGLVQKVDSRNHPRMNSKAIKKKIQNKLAIKGS